MSFQLVRSQLLRSDYIVRWYEAIAKPANKTELQTMLGTANYLAKFVSHLSDVTTPMRDLLIKDSEFVVGHATRNSVHQDERHHHPISSVSILRCLKESTSATAMREGQPIEYMSRALDESKQNWATIYPDMPSYVVASDSVSTCTDGRQL